MATLIGSELSYVVYAALFVGSYVSVVGIAYWYHWGALASLLTIPLALDLLKRYRDKNMTELPEETAKMHLPFGVLLWLGIRYSSSGFGSQLLSS